MYNVFNVNVFKLSASGYLYRNNGNEAGHTIKGESAVTDNPMMKANAYKIQVLIQVHLSRCPSDMVLLFEKRNKCDGCTNSHKLLYYISYFKVNRGYILLL